MVVVVVPELILGDRRNVVDVLQYICRVFFSFQNLAFFSELRIIEVSGDEYGVLISTPVVFSGKFVLSSKLRMVEVSGDTCTSF